MKTKKSSNAYRLGITGIPIYGPAKCSCLTAQSLVNIAKNKKQGGAINIRQIASGRQRQEDCHKFEASQGYIGKLV